MPEMTVDLSQDRLAYVTGLRGIAALVVAMGHILGMVPPDHPTFSFLDADVYHRVIWPWLFGGQAVWLFLMVSGFALYWSEARRRDAGRIPTPIPVFAGRRLWRIGPTYLVAFLFGLAVLCVGSQAYLAPSPSLDTARPVTWGGVLSHLAFVHNLNPEWINQVSPPLWSIAVEMQLYVLFPLLVLRKNGSPIVTGIGLVAGVRLVQALVGLEVFGLVEFFVAGAVLAHIARNWRPIPDKLLSAAAIAFLGLGLLRTESLSSGTVAHAIWLAGFSGLLLRLHAVPANRWTLTTWKPVQWLGERSYSLYAVHFPVALAVWWGVGRLDRVHSYAALLMVGVSVPLALVAATACYRFVELPSMRRVAQVGTTEHA